MKILIFSQYFFPENLPINFIATKLTSSGNEVDVCTGIPNYPEGKFFDDYSIFVRTDRYEDIKIYRTPIFPRGKKFKLLTLPINYLSFILSSLIFHRKVFRDNRYDAVFIYGTSPIFQAIPAIILSKIYKQKSILWVQDLWPDSIYQSNFNFLKIFDFLFRFIVKIIYRNADLLCGQSHSFLTEFIENYQIDKKNTFYLPNTIDDNFLATKQSNTEELHSDFDPNYFNILFAGNIGKAQSIDTIISCAKELRREKIKFLFAGGGSQADFLKQASKKYGLSNIILLGTFPLSIMPTLYSGADALLISLTDDDAMNKTIPSKLQSYLAFGKPILGSIGGEASNIILASKAGYVSPPEDSQGLTKICRKMSNLPIQELQSMSNYAKIYFQRNYSSKIFVRGLKEAVSLTEKR